MSRKPGDTNYSVREQRLKAEKEALKAEAKALKARLEAEKARTREVRNKLGGSK